MHASSLMTNHQHMPNTRDTIPWPWELYGHADVIAEQCFQDRGDGKVQVDEYSMCTSRADKDQQTISRKCVIWKRDWYLCEYLFNISSRRMIVEKGLLSVVGGQNC
jgi:hypothetical protein